MKISFSCSPSASARTPYPFALKFCTKFLQRLLYKRVSAFFVIIISSLYFKEKVWSKTTHFYEKYITIVSKPMKHNTIGTPFCSYSHLISVSMKKNIERTFFVCAGTQKGWETAVLRRLYHNIYRTQKKRLQ